MTIHQLTPRLYEQLKMVKPSVDRTMQYRPCWVRLTDGTLLGRVYVVEATAYKEFWGIWPSDDEAKRYVLVEKIEEIKESPFRLSAVFADRLYEEGESGMGYCIFTVVLRDGRKLPFVTGNAVDFPNWPEGVSAEMVADVLPHVGRERFIHRRPGANEVSAEFFWCLYSLPSTV